MHITTSEKSLEYSYPSSPHAEEYGQASTGCWMVAIYTTAGDEVGRKAFESKDDAMEAFNSIDAPVYLWSHKNSEEAS